MNLSTLDWTFIILFFIVSLAIGIIVSKKSGKNTSEFFLAGRNMPWWLLGISMVATTFSADTPNLVTDLVRNDGVSGNWVWWAYLLTGMLTVFVYAKLWRRSGVTTDLEFYELRYSGKAAAFLRFFRGIYLGVLFNVLVMATVCLAAIKIGGVMLGLNPIQTLLIASIITMAYSTLGGFRGILLTDFFQFILAMIGTVWACYVIVDLPEIGGLTSLLTHDNVADKLDFIPKLDDNGTFYSLLLIPLAVQWWASYYPGSEPGGGGYIAQRMLAAKDEKSAIWATLLFNIAHYALRPWPWILIGLASLIIYPDLTSLQAAFPEMNPQVVKDDLAYPAMLNYLPSGLLGLVVASLIAAFMSTISTHLNWGSSYIVNDIYKRFVNAEATEKQSVRLGRISTVVLMVLSGFVALYLENAKQIFDIIVMLGAGTGSIYILRWFWWRVNAYSEIAGMIVSFIVALFFFINNGMETPMVEMVGYKQLLLSVGITTVGWLVVTLMTRPDDQSTLVNFYKHIKPHSLGWKPVIQEALQADLIDESEITKGKLPRELMGMFAGIALVYSLLFATGYFIYGEWTNGLFGLLITVISVVIVRKNLKS